MTLSRVQSGLVNTGLARYKRLKKAYEDAMVEVYFSF